MRSLKPLVLLVFFLLELGSLASFGYWGFHIASGKLVGIVLGIGTPLLVAIFWGVVLSPKASRPVKPPLRLTLQLLVFVAASGALYAAAQPVLASVLLAAALVTMILTVLLKTYEA